MIVLEQFQVLNFKNFQSLQLDHIKNLTVLIGSNGVGKSNFLSIIDFLSQIQTTNITNYLANKEIDYKRFVHQWNLENKINFSFFLKNTELNHVYNYGFTLEYDKKLDFHLLGEFFKNVTTGTSYKLVNKNNELQLAEQAKSINECALVSQFFTKVHSYNFYNTKFFKKKIHTAHLNDTNSIAPEGENIAALLYYLYNNDKSNYESIVNSIRMVIKSFKDFHFEITQEKMVILTILTYDSEDPSSLKYLSDGTLRFIFLMLLLNLPLDMRPSLLLLEEPEIALHPHAINFLGEYIKTYAEENQIILATQSPQLLNLIDPSNVYILYINDAHATEIKYLNPEKIKKWLAKYKLGDLWIMNLLGGNPL
ncbi:AAA family ATPase [Candidatus Hepatincola sp. Av]